MKLFLMFPLLVVGCASSPEIIPGEYTIPVVRADNSVQQFTVEPDADSLMLFCIEGPETVLCIAEEGGVAQRYFMPMAPPARAERGAQP